MEWFYVTWQRPRIGDNDALLLVLARCAKSALRQISGRVYSAAILITGSIVASTASLRWHLI